MCDNINNSNFVYFRPNSVQSKDQIELVYRFAEFLKPLKAVQRPDLDLASYLNQQQLILHGVEARILRHIPKVYFNPSLQSETHR